MPSEPRWRLGRSVYSQCEARQAETIRELRELLGRSQGARQRESLLWEVQLAHVQLQNSPAERVDRMQSAPPAETSRLSGTPPVRSASAAGLSLTPGSGGRLPMARLDTPEQGKSSVSPARDEYRKHRAVGALAALERLSGSSASTAFEVHGSECGTEGVKPKKIVKKVRPSSQVVGLPGAFARSLVRLQVLLGTLLWNGG